MSIQSNHLPRAFQFDRAIVFVVIHVGAVLAFVGPFLRLDGVVCFLVMHFLCGGLGISLGAHRLFTHRSFSATRPFRWLLAWLASLNWQGGPIWWVATHYQHHGHADKEGDPHSPKDGFFWSHYRWVLYADPHRDEYEAYSRRVPHMTSDPVIVAIERHRILSQLLIAILLYAIGGVPFVLWGYFLRLAITFHSTWFVNSACHTWGYRTFESDDRSRNLWWVALLTYGEGWHNNHHSHPASARLGHRWWEIDPLWPLILCLGALRIVWDVKLVDRNGHARTLFPRA